MKKKLGEELRVLGGEVKYCYVGTENPVSCTVVNPVYLPAGCRFPAKSG